MKGDSKDKKNSKVKKSFKMSTANYNNSSDSLFNQSGQTSQTLGFKKKSFHLRKDKKD